MGFRSRTEGANEILGVSGDLVKCGDRFKNVPCRRNGAADFSTNAKPPPALGPGMCLDAVLEKAFSYLEFVHLVAGHCVSYL